MSSDRYGNRNNWRKVYSRNRRKPVEETLVDNATGISFTFDKNTLIRDRDYFLIDTARLTSPLLLNQAEYDEGLITFFGNEANNIASGSFSFTFSGVPFVVLTVESTADNQHGVNVFGISYDTDEISVAVSSEFQGDIRYRAIYSANGYPALATSPVSSSQFVAFGGSVDVNNSENYLANYPNLLFFKEYRATPWEASFASTQFQSNVFLNAASSNNQQVDGRLSSAAQTQIHFIAVGSTTFDSWPVT